MAVVLVRTLVIYFTLLLAMRLMGKRQLGEMELSEFVLAAMIADLASNPLQDMGVPLLNGLVPIATLFCCEVLIAGITLKSVRLRSVIFGKPSILIRRGKILQEEMFKNRFTLDELMQELRSQSINDLSEIEYGILETNGRLSVILFPAQRPATGAQLGLAPEEGGYPSILISDGRVLDANLRRLGLERGWLDRQLKDHGVRSPEQVYLLTATETGKVYFAKKEERT